MAGKRVRNGWIPVALSAVLLLIGVSRYLPEFWLLDILVEFTAIFVIICLGLAIFGAIRRALAVAVIAAIGFGVHGFTVWKALAPQESRLGGEDSLRITQANLLKLNQNTAWADRVLAAERPDVLLLYEFTKHHEPVLKRYPNIRRRPYRLGMEMVIASRYPIEEREGYWSVGIGRRSLAVFALIPSYRRAREDGERGTAFFA